MNNELVNMVADRIGISQEKASTAVDTVLGYVKDKLPQPIASQVDNVINKGESGGLGGALGSVFGKDKE